MGEKRRRFDPEFRAGAVRIVAETGKPVAQVAQVARDLGISAYTLHNWVKADRQRAAGRDGDGPLDEAEREELARLRAERARWEKDGGERVYELADATGEHPGHLLSARDRPQRGVFDAAAVAHQDDISYQARIRGTRPTF